MDMAVVDFRMGKASLERLSKLLKKAPVRMGRGVAQFLNNVAFEMKDEVPDTLHKKLTVRNKRFVSGSFRVQKTRPRSDWKMMVSRVASIKRARFSGWQEQVEGGEKKKTPTMSGRVRKSIRGRTKAKAKLRGVRIDPANYEGRDMGAKIGRMLNQLTRRGYKGKFHIHSYKPMISGLYTLLHKKVERKGRVYRAQPVRLVTYKANKRVQQIPFMRIAARAMLRRIDLQMVWNKSVRRHLRLGK